MLLRMGKNTTTVIAGTSVIATSTSVCRSNYIIRLLAGPWRPVIPVFVASMRVLDVLHTSTRLKVESLAYTMYDVQFTIYQRRKEKRWDCRIALKQGNPEESIRMPRIPGSVYTLNFITYRAYLPQLISLVIYFLSLNRAGGTGTGDYSRLLGGSSPHPHPTYAVPAGKKLYCILSRGNSSANHGIFIYSPCLERKEQFSPGMKRSPYPGGNSRAWKRNYSPYDLVDAHVDPRASKGSEGILRREAEEMTEVLLFSVFRLRLPQKTGTTLSGANEKAKARKPQSSAHIFHLYRRLVGCCCRINRESIVYMCKKGPARKILGLGLGLSFAARQSRRFRPVNFWSVSSSLYSNLSSSSS
ncbi:hypothetical protein KQX54_020728 [Cotesia glomerata]|uniref:Uncharacterized protein n=1 Tax=Cotesia glomerata TaxID=32391 RepID=A0AAV7I288_COTGL|nr:hypothetical protein KQX54_020728 [Cotesia glomerata]